MKATAIAAATAATLMLTSCLSPSSGAAPRNVVRLPAVNAEINYFSSFDIDDPFAIVIAGAIAEYEATSGNRVNIIWSGAESSEEIHSRLSGGLRVDIWDGDLQRQLETNSQFMLDLTNFYSQQYALLGNQPMTQIINPFLLNFVTQMSRRYAPEDAPYALLAVPFAQYNVAFVYNQAYFAQAGITNTPRTWQDLSTLSETLRARGFMPLSSQMRPYLAYGYYLARTMGTDWVEELMHTPSMWTDPAVFRMAQTFGQMASGGYLSRHEDRANPGPFALLNDRVAMWLMCTSGIRDLAAAHPGATFGAFNFPYIEGQRSDLDPLVPDLPDGQVSAMYGSRGFFIFADSPYAGYAFEMIVTIMSPSFDQQLALETLGIPFAADIPWPAEIRGIEQSFREIGAWIPYGGGTLVNPYTRQRANEQFRRLLQDRMPAREFINTMMQDET